MAKSKEKKVVGVVSVDDALSRFASLSSEKNKLMERIDKILALIDSVVDERLSKGITQRELSKLTDIKQPMIARFEKAEMMPRIDTFYRIISALDMDIKLVHNYEHKFESFNLLIEPFAYYEDSNDVEEGVFYGKNYNSELPCEA